MDEIAQGLDPDDLMDLDEVEASDLDDEEDELTDDPLPSPFQFPSSGSAATSAASSPPNTDDFPLPFGFSGKPFNIIRRGRGRPRREGGDRHLDPEMIGRLTGMLTSKPPQKRQAAVNRVRKLKPPGYPRKKFKNQDRMDFDMGNITPSPNEEISLVDPETGSLYFTDREKPLPVFEELPYFPEQWPGKVCAFCNLGERSQLGQGEMLRLICPEGFTPQRVAADNSESLSNTVPTPDREAGDKSPRGPVTCRRQKSFNKCRHPSLTSEYVDELTIIGYTEEPHVSTLFDPSGYFYTHRSCALWSNTVTKNENSTLENVGPAVLQSSSRKCSFCNHYGASILCKVEGCSKVYHFPCATASGAFQVLTSLVLYCSNHVGQASLECENAVCYTCKTLGDISNLMYCSSCGEHYHGICVGLAQLPGVRAGWQCRKCRICQVCRMTGDETKLMTCEQCDKVYHSTCQRPIVTSIPKYGWKCRCCRVCGDCGSRTPGAGLSSRWHAHYTVCDSCYQQRNKGFSCPLCHRAYRAHAHREMVQCTLCRKFVHGTCDPEADLVTYHQRKEAHPEYEYVCLMCKNLTQPASLLSKRNSIDEPTECVLTPQESPYDENAEFDTTFTMDAIRNMGIGRGKPYNASKIAKKRLGLGSVGVSGRPKGVGKAISGKVGYMKRRLNDFGRKRGAKAKMRGVFGVPGVGLQRPVSDGKNDEEPGVENRLVLCSAKDKFVLTQDICVMCGALGTDQEGCLIACVQCGQCYHPYCVNVKVTKVILQKGWRCLDCTVCEGCGQRNDEARLILCDDCDISYHIYCMDPPLDYVPHGNWKCKWCAICQTCGVTDPGFNCSWMNSFTECGPCASHVTCPSCSEPYSEGDLIIQCVQCERWLHGACDSIKTEEDAEKCAEEGYNCLLCRPRDVPPPHLISSSTSLKPPTPTKSPEVKSNNNYYVDGVYLSESGFNLIKSLSLEQHGTRKKRKKLPNVQDKEAGIMATIESVVAGGSSENMLEDSVKLELVDVKDEPQELYKEGMMWLKEDGPPPEGFTVCTVENGMSILRRKRQRNLQKLGIGGFLVRMRGIRSGQDNDDIDVLPGQSNPTDVQMSALSVDGEKPRRKTVRRKPKSKLAETFPPYLQEAFFGKDLLDSTRELDSSSSDEEKNFSDLGKTIQLTQDEIKAVAAVSGKHEGGEGIVNKQIPEKIVSNKATTVPKEEDEEDNTEDLKDVLAIPGDLLDTELVNTIMNEGDSELNKNAESLDALTGTNMPDETDITNTLSNANTSKDTKDEFSDILGPNFNLEAMPSINSKDVEDIFKGVLTDDSQESQESNVFPIQNTNTFNSTTSQSITQHPVTAPPVRPSALPNVNQSNMNSPLNFPPQSPYQSEYSNSPQFSPAFSEPPSPWVSVNDNADLDTPTAGAQSTYNQRSSEKMKADEGLGNGATISAVLYANMNHPEWKTEFPNWSDRYKQILKKWRTLSSDQKAPYLQQARDNRSALRMKKQQQSQINKDATSVTPPTTTKAPPSAAVPVNNVIPSTQVPAVAAPVSEVCTQPSRPTPSLTTASTSSVSISPPVTPRPTSLTPSPSTQQQFTVHGQFLGPGDHCGPAPNVTVNPLYQPNVANEQTPPIPILRTNNIQQQTTTPPASDQQIRVLTPSEIMRTLPSLCQENYEPQPPDQEKIALQHKSAREAEQERQWKQLQASRLQQAQQQQSIIHEQRVQSIARVQRQISDPTPYTFPQEQTPQELSPVTSPSSNPRQILAMGIKSPTFTHPNQSPMRPPPPTPSPLEFTSDGDAYPKSPATPKLPQPTFQPRLPTDLYTHQPTTPRPQIPLRPNLQALNQSVRPGEAPELNRQLRDLLQFKKLDNQLLAGKGQQRVWPPTETNPDAEASVASSIAVSAGEGTFRQPLPPSVARPRIPVPIAGVPRQPGPHIGLRMQLDPRMQGLDPRMRLLLQQQRLLQQTATVAQQQQQPPQQQQQPPQQVFSGGTVRFASAAVRPTSVEQLDQILPRQQPAYQPRTGEPQISPRLPITHLSNIQRPPLSQTPAAAATANNQESTSNEQEIPDNVTAELEKLEQETGTMAELQGVSDILGGLGDDDDELLAEMGADFNILEYADPEALPGEKTNILDLELEEEPLKNDKKVKVELSKAAGKPVIATQLKKDGTGPTTISTSQSIANNVHPPPLAISQAQSTHPLATGVTTHLTAQQIHQQMLHQVQQAAAHGKPMPPGSRLQTPDGVIGIVTPNNTVQLQLPQGHHQRLIVSQLQSQKLQMRLGQNVPRIMSVAPMQQGIHSAPVGINTGPRLAAPPPPPPPYPGPPPPYPGSTTPQQQMGLRMGPVHLPLGHIHPMRPQGLPVHPHLQRRPLLLEEQPLLLEDLLEQEKREQEKQNQNNQTVANTQDVAVSSATNVEPESSSLLLDQDFERITDALGSPPMGINTNSRPNQASTQGNWQQNQNLPKPSPTSQSAEIRVQTFNANLLTPPPLPPENVVTEQDKQKQLHYEEWLTHQHNTLTQQLKYYETEVNKLRKIRKSLNSKQRQLKKTGGQLADNDANELQRISAQQTILQKHLESSRKLSRQHGLLIQEYRNKQQTKQRPGSGQSPLLVQQNHSPLGPPSSSPIHHSNASQSPMMSPSASPLTQHSSPLHSPSPMLSHSPGPGSVNNILQSPNGMSPMQPSPRIGTPHSQGDSSPGPAPSPSQVCLPPPAPRMTSPQHKRVVTSPVGYTGDLRPGTPQMRFVRTPMDHGGGLQRRLSSPMTVYQQKPGTPSPLNSPPPQQMNINQQFIQKQLQQQGLEGQESILNSARAAQLIQQRNLVRQQLQQQQQQQQQQLQQQQQQQLQQQQQQQLQQQQQQQQLQQQQQQLQQQQQQQLQHQQQQQLQQQQQQQLQQQQQQQQIQQQLTQQHQLQQLQQHQLQQQQGSAQPPPLTAQQHQMMVQQQQQLAKQQQQQIAQMQAQFQAQQRLNQQQNNAPPSPMPPKSPLISQQIMSPHSMPPSPMPPRSPMMNFGNSQQPPNSPVTRNTGFHSNVNQQPPSSPMHSQYQPPSSPMPRSPMIQSPMGIRRPPSANSSPAMPERPTSVDPTHPRTPYSTQNSMDNSSLLDNQNGGGNPHNPNNPIPLPPNLIRFGYFKLGLRGGAPMWSFGRGAKRIPTSPSSNKELEKSNVGESSNTLKPKKESHLSRVSILKRKSPAKTNLQSLTVSKVGSLVSTDYNEFDDSSCTPPVTPPPGSISSTSRLAAVQKTVGKNLPEVQESKEILLVHSPEEKQLRCDDIIDYDDDNNTVISGEVSLSSAAQQNDGDDIAVIETFSQSDLGEAMSSPLESDQIADEYVLFPGNMVVDLSGDGETHFSDKEEVEEEDYGSENMHVVIRSPTTSDDEFIMQNKTKKYNIRHLPSNHILETADSPEGEEMQTDPSPEAADEDAISNYEESEIVIIDPSLKSPDEQISTKEDFEELIDEGSRKEKLLKQEVITAKHINEIHKYAANVYSFPSKTESNAASSTASRVTNLITSKLGQKISLITTPVVTISRSDTSRATDSQNTKLVNTASTSKLTNIFLHSGVRTNVLNVPKLVTSGSSAITIVSANTSPIASILPSGFTVPVISASAVRQLPNVKVIDKPSSSISLTTHDSCLPKKIFEDDSVSPDSSNCEDDKSKDSSDEKSKADSPPTEFVKQPTFVKISESLHSEVVPETSQTSVPKVQTPNTSSEVTATTNVEVKKEDCKIEVTENQKVDNVHVTNVKVQNQRVPSPVISKTSAPVIIHNTPELKMTAQVIQESQSGIQITARTETVDGFEGGSGDDTKSVVISIPSPTPSQEQMLDNIALQALENRRRDGNGMPGEFESFEDVLDMIENITGEPPTVLEDNFKDKLINDNSEYQKSASQENVVEDEESKQSVLPKTESKVPTTKPSVVPQLSPLSQPTDLTTNMANASQQLRTLLSLHTTTVTSSSNTEPVVKNVNQKVATTGSTLSAAPVVTSRIIQQVTTSASISTVIVPTVKQKTSPPVALPVRTQTTTIQNLVTLSNSIPTNSTNLQITTSNLNFLPARSLGIQLMPEHPKLPRVTTVNSTSPSVSVTSINSVQKSSVIVTTVASTESTETIRKTTCSLTEMLQSHPAAVPTTKTSADTITAASLLGTSIGLSRSGFSTSLVQAQPNVVVSPVTTNSIVFQTNSFTAHSSNSVTTSSGFKPVTSSTNLLHTQLTKVIRHKSLDESSSDSKLDEIKSETIETSLDDKISKPEQSGFKYSSIQTATVSRSDDSQNALLKKLLQNTACASTQTPPPSSASASITVAAPTQFSSSLESQLKASILSPVVKETASLPSQNKPLTQRQPIMTRETSFVSSPVIQHPQTSQTGATQQLHIDIKKCLPPSRTPSRDDLLSPPTPRSSCSQDSSLQTPPLTKKESMQSLQQQLSQDVKKEYVDETSQHSEVSDHSRPDVTMKEEIDSLDPMSDKLLDKEELKKQKRRMYQQKRRQNQIMNKEAIAQPKKRPRKSSKVDEDYDTYIDGVLAQLRTLPPMVVSEPILNRNFNILPIFGSDFAKLAANDYDTRYGELRGKFGNAYLPGCTDFYNTQPYGDLEPLPEKPPASTQRGFYDQEFPLIKFDSDEDKRFDMFCREDTPDSIISSSSPECPYVDPPHKFLGLKLISEDDDEEEEEEDMSKMRLSPVVPIIAPIPIRLKPTGPYLKDYTEDKENVGRDVCLKSKFGSASSAPLKDSGNVTVTLTLTSSAAEDIMGVLRDLANILHIPAPTSYQIVERTSTPPSQKLGLYRTKGKDGKEGAPIDIQSILNGAAKFCKHCDVVILNNMIRKKVSELPFLSKDSELLSDGDELFFCSTTCYMQFALMHRSPSIPEDKAAAIIDHLCQKDKADLKGKKSLGDHKKGLMDTVDLELHYFKREIEPMDIGEIKSYSLFTKQSDSIRMRRYDELEMQNTPKVWKGIRYKSWTPGCLQPQTRYKKPTDKETMELLYRMGITVTPVKMPEDTRKCMFCQGIGDGVADGPARLLNFDVDKWVHLNCGLWSDGVYETVNGALMNLENALQQSLTQVCVNCNKLGATIRCFKTRCSNVYHLACAVKDGCVFYKNKTTYCTVHIPKNEKDNELTTLSVSRRVYVNRDENRQVAAVMHHSDTNNLLRVGSLIFLNVGQLLPHQLQNFHNQNYIYPIGYKIIRFYWSMRHLNKRCKYICSIHESFGKPEFKVVIQEGVDDDVEFKDSSPKAVWHRILDQISSMRRENQCVQVFPQFVSGEDLFGLTEPAVVRVLESLPGIETLTDYKFKYGRNPLLELPLAINPSGSARTEPRSRNQLHWKRPHTQRTAGSSVRPLFGPTPALTNNNSLAEGSCPYTKQFVHSKSSQYKKMKQEWRNNVYLARSKIQGLGLYAARDLEKHTMVIEYIGEIIRTELAETREKKYEAKNRGIYMFRLDEERVVDATLCGGLARYINHSCNPNCVAETVEVDRDYRIIIFAKRRIQRGEELAYDYKFDIEDDQHKISCMCGAPNCRKWMN